MSFISYIESHLGEGKPSSSGVEFHWDCPFCTSRGETQDTRQRFRFNSNKLLGVCYNCGWGGNAVTFVKDYQKVNYAEAFDIVNFYIDFKPLPKDIFDEVFDKLYLEGQDIDSNKSYIELPEDFKLVTNTKSVLAEKYIKYARQRGLSERQMHLHGVGFCPEGEIKLQNGKSVYLENRLIIQTYNDNNKPIYWMGRAINNNLKPKTFNPVGGVNTINKSDVIFNLNNAKKTGVAVVTEGVFDATTVGDSGVALYGKTMSAKQLLLLLKADLDAVYIMLDPDAINDALKIAEMLSKHISNTYICSLKGGDPNEVGKRGCLEAIKNAEKYDKLTALKFKLLN